MDYQTTIEGRNAFNAFLSKCFGRLKPPPNLTVSQWAEQFRYLSPEASAEPGKWYNARAPHLVAPMDDLSPQSFTQEVVIMFPSQDGKTEILNNFVGYIIDQDPGPILVLQPNSKPMGEAWSKDRLAPMLRDTPRLKGKVADAKTRDSHNTVMHKLFAGGHVTITGANSPAGLASRPIRYLIADEIDRYPASAGTEGNPLKLSEKRTRTFVSNRKIVKVSSPTYDGAGIDVEYKLCDTQKKWMLQCPDCNQYQFPSLRYFSWPAHEPHNVRYVCGECGAEHAQAKESKIKQSGQWITTKEGPGLKIGYWKNQLSSFFVSWSDTIAEFLDAKSDPSKLQAFTNTALAETWEIQGETVDEIDILARREKYGAQVPNGVLVLTAAVDVQDDRLEAEVVGWGQGYESWGIEYRVLYGDTSQKAVWIELSDWLDRYFVHESGPKMGIAATCIDSGGHRTQEVYEFCRTRQARRIYPVKGRGGPGVPVVSAPNKQFTGRKKSRIKVFSVGIDEAKGIIYSRLKQPEPGPGYCHFPLSYDAEYFAQLTSEQAILKITNGVAQRRWILKKKSRRNEAFDIRVYNLAAIRLLDPIWDALEKRIESHSQIIEEDLPSAPARAVLRPKKRPQRGFVNSWR